MKTYQFNYCKDGQYIYAAQHCFIDDHCAIVMAKQLATHRDIQVLLDGRLLAQVHARIAKADD